MRDKVLVLHAEFQFRQNHLLKILSLLRCIFLASLGNLGNCGRMDIYLFKYHFYSIDLCVWICTNIMLFLSLWLYVCFYIRCGFSTQSILWFIFALTIFGTLCIQINLGIFYIWEEYVIFNCCDKGSMTKTTFKRKSLIWGLLVFEG